MDTNKVAQELLTLEKQDRLEAIKRIKDSESSIWYFVKAALEKLRNE